MLFTIAIPTYNNANVVNKAIDSALQQDYDHDYEILVVNNCSQDNTLEVLKNYNSDKLRVITNTATVTLYENHNICLVEAKGEYIVFCHSDDILLSSALRILSKRIEQRGYPERYILWGRSMCNDYAKKLKSCNQPLNEMFSGEAALIPTTMGGGLSPSGVCYSRNSLLSIGGFQQGTHRLYEGDWYVLVKAVFCGFELEMMDRLIFLREAPSTATHKVTLDEWQCARKEGVKTIINNLSLTQQSIFIEAFFRNSDISYYPIIKNYLNKRKCLLYIFRRITIKSLITKPLFYIKILFKNY